MQIEILYIASASVGGLFLGIAIALLMQRPKTVALNKLNLSLTEQNNQLNHQVLTLTKDAALAQELRVRFDELQLNYTEMQQQHANLFAQFKALESASKEKEYAQKERIETLTQAEKRLSVQFENIANKIFEKKSESFTQINNQGINALLNPLKEQIDGFKRQLTDQYVREGQERSSLKTEILSLKALNQKITEEASALTMALKGDNKQQGNWGEVVLERILSESGLREGHEFDTQVSVKSSEGKQQQPDVVVHLPNQKDVIIDSKVSLSAYEKYFHSDDETTKSQYLKEHIASLKAHIKGLSKKDYQSLPDLRTLDYVLMFVPIEPAFVLAIEADPELVSSALSMNIMLVSPTNLLVALRTINNIWQYEYQNQNAQKIAEHAAKLYDKFTNFIGDMEKVGKSVEATQKNYDLAIKKLSSGRGNLVRQIEQFRELGVQPSKKLPENLLEKQSED